jgi:hypothetical protein
MMSAEPPGGNGVTSLSAFKGNDCPIAPAAISKHKNAANLA